MKQFGVGATEGSFDAVPKTLGREHSTDLWTPRSAPDLLTWHTTESLVGVGVGTEVQTWEDSGPSGVDLSYTGSGTVRFNYDHFGRPFFNFYGPTGDAYYTGTMTINLPITAFAVVAVTPNYLNDRAIVALGDSSSSDGWLLYENDEHFYAIYAGSVLERVGFPSRAWTVVAGVLDPAGSEVWANGRKMASGDAGSRTPNNTLTLGANTDGASSFHGGFREAMIFDGHLSEARIKDYMYKLAAKWDVSRPYDYDDPS